MNIPMSPKGRIALKRAILLFLLLGILFHSVATAQERGPLIMRVEFEWTLVGIVAGAALGALVWLTDPADPNANLSDTVANGSAWGALLGAGFGLFVLQGTVRTPADTAFRRNPLHPINRVTSDPVAVESGEGGMFAASTARRMGGPTLVLPVLKMRF